MPATATGHRLVHTSPEDDDPWCAHCGRPADHPDMTTPCRKAPTERTTTP